MGNLIYPTLPGRAFPSGRSILPPKVHVRTTPSQREFRSRDALLPRYQYSVPYEWLRTKGNNPGLQALVGFYNAVGGPFDSWLYLDPDDNTVVSQPFGLGDGSTTQFQLIRAFGGFAELVDAPVSGAVVAVDGYPAVNLLAPTSSFEVDSNGDGVADGWSVISGGAVTSIVPNLGNGLAVEGVLSQLITTASMGTSNNDYVGPRAFVGRTGTAGDVYTAAASVLATAGTQIQVWFIFRSGGSIRNVVLGSPVVSTGTEQRVYVTGAAAGTFDLIEVAVTQSSRPSPGPTFMYVDAAQLEPGAAQSNYSNRLAAVTSSGVVQFVSAPPAGSALTWSGQFYRRCRFLGDRLDTEKFMAGLFAAKRVEFISVKG